MAASRDDPTGWRGAAGAVPGAAMLAGCATQPDRVEPTGYETFP